MSDLLLDTCTVLWIGQGEKLKDAATSAMQEQPDCFLVVSPISAWEIATLVGKQKISLTINPRTWFQDFCSLKKVKLAEFTGAMLIDSVNLPGKPPADPIDRILIATAREYGYTLVTRDKPILKYGKLGHIRTVEC